MNVHDEISRPVGVSVQLLHSNLTCILLHGGRLVWGRKVPLISGSMANQRKRRAAHRSSVVHCGAKVKGGTITKYDCIISVKMMFGIKYRYIIA